MADTGFLRNKIKELELRIVELSEYLNVSRPTLYKFIEYYETGVKDKLDAKILHLFDYIIENHNISKMSVINYILENIVKLENSVKDNKNQLISTIVKNHSECKIQFINIISESEVFDPILSYMVKYSELIEKFKGLKQNETAKNIKLRESYIRELKPLINFYRSLGLKLDLKEQK